jgi:hypothetical protein
VTKEIEYRGTQQAQKEKYVFDALATTIDQKILDQCMVRKHLQKVYFIQLCLPVFTG